MCSAPSSVREGVVNMYLFICGACVGCLGVDAQVGWRVESSEHPLFSSISVFILFYGLYFPMTIKVLKVY